MDWTTLHRRPVGSFCTASIAASAAKNVFLSDGVTAVPCGNWAVWRALTTEQIDIVFTHSSESAFCLQPLQVCVCGLCRCESTFACAPSLGHALFKLGLRARVCLREGECVFWQVLKPAAKTRLGNKAASARWLHHCVKVLYGSWNIQPRYRTLKQQCVWMRAALCEVCYCGSSFFMWNSFGFCRKSCFLMIHVIFLLLNVF